MNDRRQISHMAYALAAAFLLAMIFEARGVRADTGHEGATRKEIGRTPFVSRVTGSSVAGTSFFSDSVSRPDGTAFNNTSSTIWVGTVTATQDRVTHSNIGQGYPVLSSGTFPLDGSFTGSWYFTCDAGVSACEIRTAEGRVP